MDGFEGGCSFLVACLKKAFIFAVIDFDWGYLDIVT